MNTRQAEYESAIDRLRADMAARDRDAAQRDKSALDRLRADMAASDRDAAQRDRDTTRWFIGTMRWFIGIGIAIIALLIGNLIAPIFGG